MNPVNENPQLPPSAVRSMQNVSMFCGAMVRTLGQWTQRAGYRLNRMFPKDGTETMTAPLPLQILTVATLPTASSWKGGVAYTTDGGVQYSDGTVWRRVSLFPVYKITGAPAVSVANSTAETTLFTTTIKGGTLGTSGILRIRAFLSMRNDSGSSSNSTFKLYYNVTNYQQFMITNTSFSDVVTGEIDLHLVASGATNTQYISGQYIQNTGASTGGSAATGTHLMGQQLTGSEDSTTDLVLKLTVTHSVADATTYTKLYAASVELL